MDRQGYIGGTDVAAIFGLSKYKTPLQVWNEKVNGESSFKESIASRVGVANENLAGELYTEETSVNLIKPTEIKTHQTFDWVKGHFDFIREKDNNIVDAKTCSLYRAKEFGEPFSDEMPVDYLLQIAWYASIQDCEFSDLAVIIGNSEFKISRYIRNFEFEKKIFKLCKFFWEEYILKNIPPPPQNLEDAKIIWPSSSSEKSAIAKKEDIENLEKYIELCDEVKYLEKERDALKLELIKSIKDNESLVTEDGRKLITYKSTKERSILDLKKLKEKYTEIHNECLTSAPGFRVLRTFCKKEE